MSESEYQPRQIENRDEFRNRLQWMLDPPHFIDESYLKTFYDAVLQPQARREESLKIEITKEKAKEIGGNVGVEINPGQIAGVLKPMLGSFEVGGKIARSKENRDKSTHTIELTPVSTPQQQLMQLVTHCLTEIPNRLFFVDDVSVDKEWFRDEHVKDTPREIIFWDLPSATEAEKYEIPEAKLIPMAVEFTSGRIEVLHDQLHLPKRKDESWKPYIKEFECKDCISVVEKATKQESGDIRWIDYRVPRSDDRTARLHFEPHGKYDAGKFTHNLIRMSLKHGLRIVGTVQMEPDIHVIAAYRK